MRKKLAALLVTIALLVPAIPVSAHAYIHPCNSHVSHSYVITDSTQWGHKASAARLNGNLKIRVNHYFRTSSSAPWYPYNTTYEYCYGF